MKKLISLALCLSMLLFVFCGCETVKCGECGQSVSEAAAFCNKCGAALHIDPTCTACGTKNVEDARFCANCGGELKNTHPSSGADSDAVNDNDNNNDHNNTIDNDPVVPDITTPTPSIPKFGKATCATCSREGYDRCQGHPCPSCEGNWQPTCPGCHGTGKQAFEIWGSDACPVCYGLGWILCEASGCTAGKVFY